MMTYLGVFLVSMATLMYEVLLTRIFSVTTWYHFAFLCISVAMFGMTLGAILVYLKPAVFSPEKTQRCLAVGALAFGVLSVTAILVHLLCPLVCPGVDAATVIMIGLGVALPFLLAAFTASGISIALALTRFPGKINFMYAADLVGAACGCLFVVMLLRFVDPIAVVLILAAVSSLAGILFLTGAGERKLLSATGAAFVVFALVAIVQVYSFEQHAPLFEVRWSKGFKDFPNLYERWNSFSRIRVLGDKQAAAYPDAYGLSPKVSDSLRVKSLVLDIDGGAATTILNFDGKDLTPHAYLADEIAEFAHHLRHQADVLVIGAGGGKDILSALVMGQKHVTAAEINENTINAVNNVFSDFSGKLYDHPKVTVVNDEGRSYTTRSGKKFDIIEISMIDTWAATASGAYALSENGLYTTDAWKMLISHLTDNGILTVSRWYAVNSPPTEFYRLTALAAASLKQSGIEHPEQHIAILRVMPHHQKMIPDAMGTMLLCKSPFTAQDWRQIKELGQQMGFDVMLAPDGNKDPILAALASGQEPDVAASSIPFNLNAPSDDNPFFFQTISLKHLVDPNIIKQNMNVSNVLAGFLLVVVGITTLFLSVYCVRLPYLLTKDKSEISASTSLFAYFIAIGTGFMFIEISQIQRLGLFLGHPVYGLTVVLFALLLSTGVGSLLLEQWLVRRKGDLRVALVAIVVVLSIYGLVSGMIMNAAYLADTPTRIAVAVAMLFPVGIALGAAFPAGMNLTLEKHPSLAPWLWGVNGAFSVCASVFAVIVSMFSSITVSYICGIVSYVVALVAVNAIVGPGKAAKETAPAIEPQ